MKDFLNGKKGIFFDIGWTLDKPASGDWMLTHALRQCVGDARLDAVPRAVLEAALEEGIAYLKERHLLFTCEEEEEQFTAYYAILNRRCALGMSEEDVRAVAHDRTYGIRENYVFFDDALPTVKALSERFRLGIISDTWPSAAGQLAMGGITPYLSCHTFSNEVGVFKPHPRIYRHALDGMGLPPEQTVFIDDLPANLDGAAAMGITPVLIVAHEGADVPTPYAKIHALHELLEGL